jgi:hypothetical protein
LLQRYSKMYPTRSCRAGRIVALSAIREQVMNKSFFPPIEEKEAAHPPMPGGMGGMGGMDY